MVKSSKQKITDFVIVVLVIVICVIVYNRYHSALPVPLAVQTPASTSAVTIGLQNTQESNFNYTIPTFSGTSPLIPQVQQYIIGRIADFKESADEAVPAARAKFGTNSPMAQYQISIDATYITSSKTESIVLSEYSFTGGANGSTTYKVFTSALATGKLLSLSDIIPKNKQADFTKLVKNELDSWVPDGSSTPVVFPDQVSALTFDSFTNWSLDNNNLTIYFDQYEIAPGDVGPVAFPFQLSVIKNFLNQNLL